MAYYKFGQISSKKNYEAIDIDIKMLNFDKIVVSDPVIDDKKGKSYIVVYNIDGKIVTCGKKPLRIYTLKVCRNTMKH